MKPDNNILEIHLNSLEKDCQQQPKLLYEWGRELADAKREAALARNKIKVVAANLYQQICKNPGEYGLEKTTEKAVDSAVLTHDEYQVAQEESIEAEHAVDVLQAFIYALNDRKTELENMVKLHGQQYWSKPDTPQQRDTDRIGTASGAAKSINNPKRRS